MFLSYLVSVLEGNDVGGDVGHRLGDGDAVGAHEEGDLLEVGEEGAEELEAVPGGEEGRAEGGPDVDVLGPVEAEHDLADLVAEDLVLGERDAGLDVDGRHELDEAVAAEPVDGQ